jgi:tRNA(Ile)-lysidine synthase
VSLTDILNGQVASNLDAAFASELPKCVGIAVSGGGDSIALLHLTHAWATVRNVTLSAITIDHNLRDSSAEETASVAQWCAELGVLHTVRVWRDWDHNGNLQDAARQARYRLINDWRGDIEHILIGHTLDDQAETLLLRLKRGSGVDGMTGMRSVADHPCGMTLIRPLLNITRQDLRDYLVACDQSWFDDPSNDNTAFDRIAMRQLLPQLKLAGISLDRFALMSSHMQRAQDALDHTAKDVFQTIGLQQGTDLIFDQSGFFETHSETQSRLISAGLCWISGNAYRPRFEALQRALSDVQDGKTSSLHGCLIYPHQKTLRITREYAATQSSVDQTVWDGRWQGVDLPTDYSVQALGEHGAAQLVGDVRKNVPFRSLSAQPAIFFGERLMYTPTLDQTQRQFVQDLRINFIDFITSH